MMNKYQTERNKAQDGRYDYQKDGNNLGNPSLCISSKWGESGQTPTDGVILIKNINTATHRDAAQQDRG